MNRVLDVIRQKNVLQYYMAMLYNIAMARGESGRIVLEIDPSEKDNLYTALTKDGLTLKDWFLRQAEQYLRDRDQIPLFGTSLVSEESNPYKIKPQAATSSPARAKNSPINPKAK